MKLDKLDLGFILLAIILTSLTIPFFTLPDPRVVLIAPSFLWQLSHFITIITGSLPFGLMFWCLLAAEYLVISREE